MHLVVVGECFFFLSNSRPKLLDFFQHLTITYSVTCQCKRKIIKYANADSNSIKNCNENGQKQKLKYNQQ